MYIEHAAASSSSLCRPPPLVPGVRGRGARQEAHLGHRRELGRQKGGPGVAAFQAGDDFTNHYLGRKFSDKFFI
jgi:hypothetical protein